MPSHLPAPQRRPGHRARVLVVEDHAGLRELVRLFLRSAGHDVVAAGSGEQALMRLAAAGVDLVLSDVEMPGMSGLELVRVVRRRWPGTGTLLMSASARHRTEASRLGVALVAKPFAPADLLEAVGSELAANGSAVA
jgi:CheY-like chemotaxis protein